MTQVPMVDYLVLGDQPHLVANECEACGARFFDRRNACAACDHDMWAQNDLVTMADGFDEVRVRFRMDGVLYTSLLLPLDVHQAIVSRIKILSNLKIDETRVPQDGRFHTKFENKEIDLC